ncbi:MAG: hypothetical protein CM15mV58_250 [uncultured marine virus]|nr:MAG: hypothetical protein CM15mV58_250 [uncultured marine virus]
MSLLSILLSTSLAGIRALSAGSLSSNSGPLKGLTMEEPLVSFWDL